MIGLAVRHTLSFYSGTPQHGLTEMQKPLIRDTSLYPGCLLNSEHLSSQDTFTGPKKMSALRGSTVLNLKWWCKWVGVGFRCPFPIRVCSKCFFAILCMHGL